jgi:hypothetical protein
MIRRREFITLLSGTAAWPLAARAQQPGKAPTVGLLGATTPATAGQWIAAFAQRLRELGWTEGRTVAIEYRFADGRKRTPLRGCLAGVLSDPFGASNSPLLASVAHPLMPSFRYRPPSNLPPETLRLLEQGDRRSS